MNPITTEPKSVVGLWCYYNSRSSQLNLMVGSQSIVFQSSGVIINPQGYILTAKHVVDPAWTKKAYATSTDGLDILYDNIDFDHCDVGNLPDGRSLPTPDDIKTFNPMLDIGAMRYRASLYFDPPQGSMSESEFETADFAILKITGPADHCSTWYTDCSSSGPFPYAPVLYSSIPAVGQSLITYGFPVEASPDYQSKLFLKGAVGRIAEYDNGDNYFKNTPFQIQWTADDVMGGRSGSPVFWKGYAIGVLYEKTTYSPTSTIMAMPAIYKILSNNGLGNVLRIQ